MSQVVTTIADTPYEEQMQYGPNFPSTLVQAFTAATFAAVAVPANSIGVFILPQPGNTGTITFKGVTGDTGVNLPKSGAYYQGLDIAVASFGLLCASSIAVVFVFV